MDIFPDNGVLPGVNDYDPATAAVEAVYRVYGSGRGACPPRLDPAAFDHLLGEWACQMDKTLATDGTYNPASFCNLHDSIQWMIDRSQLQIDQMVIV